MEEDTCSWPHHWVVHVHRIRDHGPPHRGEVIRRWCHPDGRCLQAEDRGAQLTRAAADACLQQCITVGVVGESPSTQPSTIKNSPFHPLVTLKCAARGANLRGGGR